MGRGSKSTSLLEYILVIYLISALVLGVGLIAVGMWMNIDLNVKAYLIVFRRYPEDDLLMAGTACFIVAGLIICGISVMAMFALFRKMPSLLLIFIAVSFLVLVMEWTIGFMIVKFRHDIHRDVKQGMIEQIENEYMWDNEVGHAWNRVQLRKKCCGADGSWDYYQSEWWLSENPGVEDPNEATYNVPDTCCVLEYNQDRDPGKVNPQDPRPKDQRRCNEDAAGRKDGSGYLHGRGCFAKMLDFVGEYYWSIMALSLFTGLCQIASMILGWMVYCDQQDDDEPENKHMSTSQFAGSQFSGSRGAMSQSTEKNVM